MPEGRIHTTGKYLADQIGKSVVLEGFITKLSADGRNVELTTFDKVKVNVALNEVYNDEASGIMQIFGTVKSKTTLAADTYVRFPPEDPAATEFDPDDHNSIMAVLNVVCGGDIAREFNIVKPSTDIPDEDVPIDLPDNMF